MQNGYFRLVKDATGFGVSLIQPTGCGEEIRMEELFKYLSDLKIPHDKKRLEVEAVMGVDVICHLGNGECPVCDETFYVDVSEDNLLATVRFIAPSEGGKRLTMDGFLDALAAKQITYGLDTQNVQAHFNS